MSFFKIVNWWKRGEPASSQELSYFGLLIEHRMADIQPVVFEKTDSQKTESKKNRHFK